jgi:hypothetical protein
MDWSPGVGIREQFAYGHDDESDRWPDLGEAYFLTVQEIDRTPNANKLRTALRSYAAAMQRALPALLHGRLVREISAGFLEIILAGTPITVTLAGTS